MASVNVTIAGKSYRMACEDGQEAHLAGLAADLDAAVGKFRKAFGEIGDLRLIVMAAIAKADELVDLRGRLARAESELAALRQRESETARHAATMEAEAAAEVSAAARRILAAARQLNGSD